MPPRNPRVNVVLEKPPFDAVGHLAGDEGVRLSQEFRTNKTAAGTCVPAAVVALTPCT